MKNTLHKEATLTSKGQITVPRDVRRALGLRAGDRLLFEGNDNGMQVRKVRRESPFAKYEGIGTVGLPSGRKAINRWLRDLRGR